MDQDGSKINGSEESRLYYGRVSGVKLIRNLFQQAIFFKIRISGITKDLKQKRRIQKTKIRSLNIHIEIDLD